MIQIGTRLKVADNSGAKEIMCLSIPGRNRKKYAHLGDIISSVVKSANSQGEVKNHQVVRALVVRTKKEQRRKDGSYIRFDQNAAVIVDKQSKTPKGTRIMGPIAREVKEKGFKKIASLAKEVY